MSEVREAGPADCAALVQNEGYALVDVRSEPEFSSGHPQGALNIPLKRLGPAGMEDNPRFVEVMQALFPARTKLVLSCRTGARSLVAARLLERSGFSLLVNQRAGLEGRRDAFGGMAEAGWAAVGLPVETATPGGTYEEILQRV